MITTDDILRKMDNTLWWFGDMMEYIQATIDHPEYNAYEERLQKITSGRKYAMGTLHTFKQQIKLLAEVQASEANVPMADDMEAV